MAQIMSTAEIESALIYYENTYPTLCRRIELPNKTIENRTCHALHMGQPNSPGSPAGLIIGGVHAREWGGPDIVINFAGDLLRAYTGGSGLEYGSSKFTAADIKRILDQSTIVVFPCVNPDGVEFSHNDVALWRKNRNPASSGGDPAKIGVDINRNYDFLWNYKKYFSPSAWDTSLASDDASTETFHGTAPFSEPETRNVKWLIDSYVNLTMFLDLHSYTGDVLYNWGDDDNQSSDPGMNFANSVYDGQRGQIGTGYAEFIAPGDQQLASTIAASIRNAMNGVRGRPYLAKQAVGLYPTAGSSDDYAYSRHLVQPGRGKIFGFTIEFNFATDGSSTNPATDPFLVTADPAVLDQTMLDVIPGLIAFSQNVKRITLPPLETAPATVNIVHANPFTGETWSVDGGKIHKTPPIPDPYRTKVGNEIWRLLAAFDGLHSVGGLAGQIARKGLLEAIAEVARANAGAS